MVQVGRLDDIWRNHVDDVAERPQQDALFEKERIKARPHLRQIAGIRGVELNGRNGTDPANVRNRGMAFERSKPLVVNGFDVTNAIKNRFRFEDLEAGDPGGASQRISAIGVSMEQSMRPVQSCRRRDRFLRCRRSPRAA